MDLSVNFAGLELKNPLVVASSDNTRNIRQVKKAEECGASAVILKGAIRPHSIGLQSTLRLHADVEAGALHGHAGTKRHTFDQAIELVKVAKKETKIKIGANTAFNRFEELELYADFAERAARAGADFVEMHFSPQIPVHTVVSQTPEEWKVQRGQEAIRTGAVIRDLPMWVSEGVKAIKQAVDVPVIAKINSEGLDIVAVAKAIENAGADAISPGGPGGGTIQIDIFNGGRLIMPGANTACLHTVGAPWKPYAQGIVARVAQAVGIPIMGGGGLMNWRDVVEMIMFGATTVSFCSLLLIHGFEAIARIKEELERFIEQQGYGHIDDFRGLALKYVASSFPACEVIPSVARVDEEKCIGCGQCLKLAACLAISMENDKAVVNEEECLGCGMCTLVCPADAVYLVEIPPKAS